MGYKINQVIETGNKKIQTGTEEYIKFLKVVGNNYFYVKAAGVSGSLYLFASVTLCGCGRQFVSSFPR